MKYLQINLILLVLATSTRCHIEPIVLVHGGADSVDDRRIEGRMQGVKKAVTLGYKLMKQGGSVTDAVEAAIRVMEEDENFNAGYGSTLNADGEVEMDAAIMVGSNFSSGGVTCIKNIEHPISLARMVMSSPFFLLSGEGARRFAKDKGVPLVPSSSLVAPHATTDLEEYKKRMVHELTKAKTVTQAFGAGSGGVGAIAVDQNGHVAAASSTGGRLGKMPGRSSDASIVGAGLYADDEVGAVVVTGHGEAIARYVMAHEVISTMRKGFDAGVATRNVVKGITQKFRQPTGAITVSKHGQVGISFTTEKMAWAYQIRDSVHYGMDDYDHFSEKIKI